MIVRGRFGRALIAVRDHESAAQTVGINVAFVKVLAFALSALYAGVAGSFGCPNVNPARLSAAFGKAWKERQGFEYSRLAWQQVVDRPPFGQQCGQVTNPPKLTLTGVTAAHQIGQKALSAAPTSPPTPSRIAVAGSSRETNASDSPNASAKTIAGAQA